MPATPAVDFDGVSRRFGDDGFTLEEWVRRTGE
jgi:hypothetical protein